MATMQTDERDTGGDWLEEALRAEAREQRSAYVTDGGFTAAVMARLPEPARLPTWRRPVVALLWLSAGAAAMLAVPGLFDDAFRSAVAMLVGHRMSLADVAGFVTLLGALTWGTLVYAARTE
jgi:hypothetical protein